jgi:hypothetical protein
VDVWFLMGPTLTMFGQTVRPGTHHKPSCIREPVRTFPSYPSLRWGVYHMPTDRATANLKINLTQIQVLGQQWNSADISQVYNNLTSDTTNANSGSLTGNRMFYANDYMVSSLVYLSSNDELNPWTSHRCSAVAAMSQR